MPFVAHLPELSGTNDTNPLLFASTLPRFPHSGLVAGTPFIDGNAANSTLALGHLAAEDWLHFRLPWWNHYTGIGLPLAAEMQPAAFFLPFILLLHFSAGVLYMKIAVQVLAGLTMLGFLRSLGLTRLSCALGAILFQLNGTFAWYSDAPIFPLPFLPLLLWGVERSYGFTARGTIGGGAMVAAAIGGSLLAGFPETAYVDGTLALCWAAMRAAEMPRAQALRFARTLLVGGVVGLAIAAPALLPFLIDLPVSTLGARAADTDQMYLASDGAVTLLFPYIFGSIYANAGHLFAFWLKEGGYVGCVVVFLAIGALLRRPDQVRQRLVLATWVAAMLCVILDAPLLSGIIRLLPGFHVIHVNRYGMPGIEFAACVLAAMALDDHARGHSRKYAVTQSGCVVVLGALLIVLARHMLARNFLEWPEANAFALGSVGWSAMTLGAIALLFSLRSTPRRRTMLAALIVGDSIALFTLPSLSGLRRPELADGPIAFLKRHQGFSRAISTDNTLFPNYGALVQLGMVQYEYIPVPADWANYVIQHLDPYAFPTSWPGFPTPEERVAAVAAHRRDLEDVGVRYVVVQSAMNPFNGLSGPSDPKRVYSEQGIDIFELPGAKPYADIIGGPCTLTILDRDKMDANCQSLAWLVRRELFFHGWQADVNGQAMPIMRHGEIFQAIPLAGGHSRIRWHYRPPFSLAIWLVFLAGSAGFVALLWQERHQARHR